MSGQLLFQDTALNSIRILLIFDVLTDKHHDKRFFVNGLTFMETLVGYHQSQPCTLSSHNAAVASN